MVLLTHLNETILACISWRFQKREKRSCPKTKRERERLCMDLCAKTGAGISVIIHVGNLSTPDLLSQLSLHLVFKTVAPLFHNIPVRTIWKSNKSFLATFFRIISVCFDWLIFSGFWPLSTFKFWKCLDNPQNKKSQAKSWGFLSLWRLTFKL